MRVFVKDSATKVRVPQRTAESLRVRLLGAHTGDRDQGRLPLHTAQEARWTKRAGMWTEGPSTAAGEGHRWGEAGKHRPEQGQGMREGVVKRAEPIVLKN